MSCSSLRRYGLTNAHQSDAQTPDPCGIRPRTPRRAPRGSIWATGAAKPHPRDPPHQGRAAKSMARCSRVSLPSSTSVLSCLAYPRKESRLPDRESRGWGLPRRRTCSRASSLPEPHEESRTAKHLAGEGLRVGRRALASSNPTIDPTTSAAGHLHRGLLRSSPGLRGTLTANSEGGRSQTAHLPSWPGTRHSGATWLFPGLTTGLSPRPRSSKFGKPNALHSLVGAGRKSSAMRLWQGSLRSVRLGKRAAPVM
jgi:hypothetical protein